MYLYPDTFLEKIGFEHLRDFLLGESSSEMGRERIKALSFSTGREDVAIRLRQTEQMLNLLKGDESVPLYSLPDIRPHLKKVYAEGSTLPPEAVLNILTFIQASRHLKQFVKRKKIDYEVDELEKITGRLEPLKNLEHAITAILDEEGKIRNDASPKLQSLRKRLNKKKSEVRHTVQKVMQRAVSKGMASEEGITIRSGRMVLPIRVEYKRKIDGFVHDISSSGQTVFLEPVEALNLNNEIRQLEIEERNEIERLLKSLTGNIRTCRDQLSANVEQMTQLDVILTKARLGEAINGVIPMVTSSGILVLREAKNPVLLLKNKLADNTDPVVPLHLELNPSERCLVITGPNAGGKSVALKTLALCCLMMQSGIPVPADKNSRLPLFKQFFLDMGDDQSIESDLSTFSSRLRWMQTTLQHSGPESLVMIDEAGSGTDPEEGTALYQAFIEKLIAQKCRCLVTTHHGSLKLFADEQTFAINGSMEFDTGHLTPTYRFKKGIPGSSYAFEIATRMQLDTELIARAKELLGQPKRRLDKLITDLEAKTHEAQSSKQKYSRLKSDAEKLKQQYEEKLANVQQKRKELKTRALQEAEEIVNQANSKLERVIQEISEQSRSLEKKHIKKARRQIDTEKKSIKKKLRKQQQAVSDSKNVPKPKTGDLVRLKDTSTTGELVEIDDHKAVILVNGLRLKTDYRKLEKVRSDKDSAVRKKSVPTYSTDYQPRKRLSPSIMIRGMRAEEAMKHVERYIDDATAAGLHQVQIIHGKGEGILKGLVHNYLDQRKEVAEYRIAPVHQGGAGCTIVTLR